MLDGLKIYMMVTHEKQLEKKKKMITLFFK